jgi:membrane fusion protein (multidrug efflux system)
MKLKHIAFVLALTGLALLTACKDQKKGVPPPGGRRSGPINVDVMVVSPDSLRNIIYTTGTLLPNEKIELRNEVAGRIIGIFFEEGTEVAKGTLLLKINDQDLQAQLTKNEVQEKMALDDEFRKRKLLDIKAISQEEYDVSANLLKSVQSEKKLLEAQIAKTEIIAPLSGKIGLRNVSPGSYIPTNSLIATLQQVDPIKIEFTVPEKYIRLIKNNMEIRFSMDYTQESFTGRVYAVESGVDPATRTIRIRAICSNSSRKLAPGAFTRISLILEELPDAIRIPSEALVGDIDGNKVFLLKKGKASSVKVETGIRTESDVQITSGLQPGDSLILTGLLQVIDGTPVVPRLRSAKPPGSSNQ